MMTNLLTRFQRSRVAVLTFFFLCFFIGCQMATANSCDMVNMTSEITVNGNPISRVVSVEIDKDAEKLQDVATIKLPATLYGKSLNIDDKVRRGDKVSIALGYNGENEQEFTGYVTSVSYEDNIIIRCEDALFLFRKGLENKQYKVIGVADLAKDVASQIGGVAVVAQEGVEQLKFDKFTINEATGAEALQKIKEELKLDIYLRGEVLHLSLPYGENRGQVRYDFFKNIERASLKWLKFDERKVLVKVIGIAKDNSRTEVTVGDSGGDKITINRYNVTKKEMLEQIGKNELEKWKIDGYEGSLTGWLAPFCTYGHTAKITDKEYPNRQGTYFIKAVKIHFDSSGGKRQITLGKRFA